MGPPPPELSERFEGVHVRADNQGVLDRSELAITAVRRQDHREALAGLKVNDDKTVVNLMAGVVTDDLRRTLATGAPIVRAIPLPAVRERRSVTVTCPSHPVVDSLFEQLGGALPVADESSFNIFSALTGTLTAHYAYLAALTSWTTGHAPKATTSASEPPGSIRPTPQPSRRPWTASSPIWSKSVRLGHASGRERRLRRRRTARLTRSMTHSPALPAPAPIDPDSHTPHSHAPRCRVIFQHDQRAVP
ncbi:hypothetical protein SSP35_21_00860 [Streptomyces sp. NBRC 110611]|uniref:hypothetical protein n=1 Tax=Streptomyces sp. NBRC 110611 TaxID=1621259 RepID=UPI0008565DFD|nr:hypothetical protein [Streptomyces sp. NBRC 110611]GAU70691.1 hypothetical protein SSP35_21_00860 [Streptomyces sp. NBRC 110611]